MFAKPSACVRNYASKKYARRAASRLWNHVGIGFGTILPHTNSEGGSVSGSSRNSSRVIRVAVTMQSV